MQREVIFLADHIGGVDNVLESVDNHVKEAQLWKYPLDSAPDESAGERGIAYVQPRVEFQNLQDKQELEIEGARLQAFYTPGHAEDHVVLHLKEENALFSGDNILGSGSTTVFENFPKYMRSLQKMLSLNPGRIYPAHGEVIENGTEKIQEYITHRLGRERQILEWLEGKGGCGKVMVAVSFVKFSDSSTIESITRGVYTEIDEILIPAAAINVKHHLEKLIDDGKVSETNEKYRLT